jgi:UDP-galactopyranose mutase
MNHKGIMVPPSKKNIDLICLSHLRWNFVYQRPQHLMSRFVKERRVFFFEEPVYDAPSQYNEIFDDPVSGVCVVTPHITSDTENTSDALRHLLDMFMASMEIKTYVTWYYTPLSFVFSEHLKPALLVNDCMDELSSFKFAAPELKDWEQKLFTKADIVFTGGMHLYEAKKKFHSNIHGVPSGIDVKHFIQARKFTKDPVDQASIPHPRIGFYGVIDERFNIELLRSVAEQRPDWHLVVIGPTAKIDPASLPTNRNIHFIGMRDYKELPGYLAGWDVAMMPFELNEATKYISPTKTPEFLAAGKPVVSTSIHDVVHPYADKKVVSIADTPGEFVAAIEQYLSTERSKHWLNEVDSLLETMSWDDIWKRMNDLMNKTINTKTINHENKSQAFV